MFLLNSVYFGNFRIFYIQPVTSDQEAILQSCLLLKVNCYNLCYFHPAYGRHWISECVRIVAPIQEYKIFHLFHVRWNMSRVTFYVSTVTVTVTNTNSHTLTDLPPANVHHRTENQCNAMQCNAMMVFMRWGTRWLSELIHRKVIMTKWV